MSKRKNQTTTSSSKRPKASENNASTTSSSTSSSSSSSTTNQPSLSRTLSEHTYPNEGENHGSPGQVTGRRSDQDQLDSTMNVLDSFDFDEISRFASGEQMYIPTSVFVDNSSSNFKRSRQSSLRTFSNTSNQSEIPSNSRQSSLSRGIPGYNLDILSHSMSLSTGSGVASKSSVPSIPPAQAQSSPSIQRAPSSDQAAELWPEVPNNERQESGEEYKQLLKNEDFNTRVAQYTFIDECHWKHRKKKDCKYCTERKKGIKPRDKQEWRKNKNFHGKYDIKTKKSLLPVDAQTGQLDIVFDHVNFGDRLCKSRHEALGDLVLYCQKRARKIPMNSHPFPLSDVEIQQRQEALVAYGYRINDYVQWTHKWVHDVAHLPNIPGKKAANRTSQDFRKVDQYVHDFFNVGLSQKVSVRVEDVLQLAKDLGMDSISSGGVDPDQYHGSNRNTKIPQRLKAKWTALELANVLRQVGRMEHAASCVRIALNVGNCRGHDKDDLTPEKYLLDKARLMQVRITCVKLNRETDPSLKKTFELELIKMYQTLSTSASKTSDRLQARYQQCEFMFEKAMVEENKEHQVRYVNELKELETLHQQEHEKQTREQEEKKTSSSSTSSTSSTSSSSTSSSTSSSCKYLPSLVSWHHVINSRISATYQCNANGLSNSNNWKQACDEWKKELRFRQKTYLTGVKNRHVVYLNKLLGEHYLKVGKFTEATKHLESALTHAIDEHYKIKINALLSRAKSQSTQEQVDSDQLQDDQVSSSSSSSSSSGVERPKK